MPSRMPVKAVLFISIIPASDVEVLVGEAAVPPTTDITSAAEDVVRLAELDITWDCGAFVVDPEVGAAFVSVREIKVSALKPPFADMIEFSSANTTVRSFCALEGNAVMYSGGAVERP